MAVVAMSVEEIGKAAGAILAVLTIVGLIVRYVLIPYLDKHLVQPISERLGRVEPRLTALEVGVEHIVHETTPNGGSSMKDSMRRIETRLNEHISAGRAETDALWKILDRRPDDN